MGRLAYHDEHDPNNEEPLNEINEVLMKAVYYYRETIKFRATKDRAAEVAHMETWAIRIIFWVTLYPSSTVINKV